MKVKKNVISIALVFICAILNCHAAGPVIGFNGGMKSSLVKTDSENNDFDKEEDAIVGFNYAAGINFRYETIPLYFYADAFFSDNSFDGLEFSFDYYIKSPVFPYTELHFFFGPSFSAGIFKNYYTAPGFCLGLFYLPSSDFEIFAKYQLDVGLAYEWKKAHFYSGSSLKSGVRFYF